MSGDYYFFVAALLLTGLSAWYDWRTGEIPNWLTLGAIGSGVIGRAIVSSHTGSAGWLIAFGAIGAGICVLVPLVMHRIGMMGGGDLKLLAGMGALLGPFVGMEAQFYAFMVGVIAALVRLAWRGRLLASVGSTLLMAKNAFVVREHHAPVPEELAGSIRFAPYAFAATAVTAALHWRI